MPVRPLTFSLMAIAIALPVAACRPATNSTRAAATPPTGAGDLVARGRYLVQIGGCNDCHTEGYGARGGDVPESQWLLGSRSGFLGPWGTSYATNLRLTADRLDQAAWLSYTATLQARPLMPAYMLRKMQEQDRLAIYRFLRALGPAGEPAPAALPPGQHPSPPYLELVLPPETPTKP